MRSLSVMVVAEDSAEREGWTAAFEAGGFRVLRAENRLDALKYLDEHLSGIDLLVTGTLRDGEGLRLASGACERYPALAIVIVAWEASPVGIHDRIAVLLEPVSDAEMMSTARSLLRGSGWNILSDS